MNPNCWALSSSGFVLKVSCFKTGAGLLASESELGQRLYGGKQVIYGMATRGQPFSFPKNPCVSLREQFNFIL